MPEQRNVTEARQGVTGHGVRYVLAISLAMAVLLLGAYLIYVAA